MRYILYSAVKKGPNEILPSKHYFLDYVFSDGSVLCGVWEGNSYWDAVCVARDRDEELIPLEDLVGDRTSWKRASGIECDEWGWQGRHIPRRRPFYEIVAMPEGTEKEAAMKYFWSR
jgi:hypothetical protein